MQIHLLLTAVCLWVVRALPENPQQELPPAPKVTEPNDSKQKSPSAPLTVQLQPTAVRTTFPPVIQQVHDLGVLPPPNPLQTGTAIRKSPFVVTLGNLSVDDCVSIFFNGAEVNSTRVHYDPSTLTGSYCVAPKLPPGRYRLSAGVKLAPSSLRIDVSPSVSVDFQPAQMCNLGSVKLWQKPQTLVKRLSDSVEAPPPDEKTQICQNSVLDYRFHAPAQFPLPSLGPNGEPFEDQGVLIYEGMQFSACKCGRYKVRYIVETPAMPVSFRLQLIVSYQSAQQYTLTLPSVEIPGSYERKQAETGLYEVTQEGFLPAFVACNCNQPQMCVVRRQGAARMGFGLDVP